MPTESGLRPAAEPAALPARAGLAARMASLLYEVLLLAAILFAVTTVFTLVAPAPLSSFLKHVLRVVLLAVAGLYFVICWHRGGQTLPMKTWRLQLVGTDGGPMTLRQLVTRYLVAVAGAGCFGAGFLWAVFDRDRQFLHDRLAGTRIIRLPRGKTGSPAAE